MTSVYIPGEAEFVTGVQALRSPRRPFRMDTVDKVVREGRIETALPSPCDCPVFSVAQIDTFQTASSDDQTAAERAG